MTASILLDHGLKGSLIALAIGVAGGIALRPTPAETSEPATPQLIVLKPGEAASFDAWDARRHR